MAPTTHSTLQSPLSTSLLPLSSTMTTTYTRTVALKSLQTYNRLLQSSGIWSTWCCMIHRRTPPRRSKSLDMCSTIIHMFSSLSLFLRSPCTLSADQTLSPSQDSQLSIAIVVYCTIGFSKRNHNRQSMLLHKIYNVISYNAHCVPASPGKTIVIQRSPQSSSNDLFLPSRLELPDL